MGNVCLCFTVAILDFTPAKKGRRFYDGEAFTLLPSGRGWVCTGGALLPEWGRVNFLRASGEQANFHFRETPRCLGREISAMGEDDLRPHFLDWNSSERMNFHHWGTPFRDIITLQSRGALRRWLLSVRCKWGPIWVNCFNELNLEFIHQYDLL